MLSLPRMEIQKFDGNPLNYYNFIAVFDECVDKPISDCQTKLMRLFQFTTGDANYAIRESVSVGGSEGYSEARDILNPCATFVDLRDSPDFQTLNIAWSPLIHSIVVNIVWKVCSNNLTTAT